jgi:Vacuolar protein sorting-associated protein 62
LLKYDRDEPHMAASVETFVQASELRDGGRAVLIRRPTADGLAATYPDGRRAHGEDHLARVRSSPAARPVTYGHVVRSSSGTWLQYWFLYLANPQDRGVVRTGRHVGDWEFVQVRLDGRSRPRAVTFAQHKWAEKCGWSEVEHLGGAPVVYVARGSHASYPRRGTHGRPFPDPDDEADGRGRTVRPDVRRVDARHPGWVRWPGRWGQTRAGIVPAEETSPRGPAFQEDGRWSQPAAFDAEVARPCGSGAPGRLWLWASLLGGVALGLVALGLAMRRWTRT